jgi:hypothetical protein
MGFPGNTPKVCGTCGRPYAKSKGRSRECVACYLRRTRGHEVSGPCAVCGLSDRRVLRRHVLTDGPVTLCANDAAIAGRRALSLEELELEVYPAGDRRGANRRQADRRAPATDRRTVLDVARLVADADRRGAGRRASDAA